MNDVQLLAAYSALEQGKRPIVENVPDFIKMMAFVIDHAGDRQNEVVAKAAVGLIGQFESMEPDSGQKSYAYYCVANAYDILSRLQKTSLANPWLWDCEFHGHQIYFLRKAIAEPAFNTTEPSLRAQVYTNLGNALSRVGRIVEARERWNQALNASPNFGMALGNRGIGCKSFAQFLYDDGHVGVILQHAYDDLVRAVNSRTAYDQAKNDFEQHRKQTTELLGQFPEGQLNLESFSPGKTIEEREYRSWCLRNTLFLNPLNDMGAYSIAATDVFHLGSMRVIEGEGPQYFGFFNQMKQEYTAARYFYYEGVSSTTAHFADKDVSLVNTFDYPAYSLSVERVKVAYRLLYSIFDKIGYFINAYWSLGIPFHLVNFRTLWLNDRHKPERGLRPEVTGSNNWPLQGLYWLSKDLFVKDPAIAEVIEPAARELDAIRNHIEHKYFKLHTEAISLSRREDDLFFDGLSYSMWRKDFIEKTLNLMKLTRASLLYLSMAVHASERQSSKAGKGMTLPLWLDTYEDSWKR